MTDRAGKSYRPSNGTEGEIFHCAWCGHCARDAAFQDDPDSAEGCPIVADSYAYNSSDPSYPKEWIYDRNGNPCCTAFTADPSAPVRCDDTIDMFTGKSG